VNKVLAVLDKIEAQQAKREGALIPDEMTVVELADAAVRGKVKLSAQQMRLLIELLPYHMPKLSAVALGHFEGSDFTGKLERAISRSAKVIEGKVLQINGQVGIEEEH
jgi:hypothetical protein